VSRPRVQCDGVQPMRSARLDWTAPPTCEVHATKPLRLMILDRPNSTLRRGPVARPLPIHNPDNEFGSQAAPVNESASPAQHRPCAAPPAPVSFFRRLALATANA